MLDLVRNPEDRFSHNEAHNTPMLYTAIFHGCKNDVFQMKKSDIFHIFAQNIDRGYTLESTHDQCFRAKIRKTMYTHVNPSFTI